MDANMTLDRLALSMVDGLGPMDARRLLEAYQGNIQAVFHDEELAKELKLSDKVIKRIHDKSVWQRAEQELEFIEKHRIKVLWFEDEDYPSRLKECPDAPLLLYKKGNANLDAQMMLAIVGTRKMTSYGRTETEKLVDALAQSVPGLLIVSGLALGVDVCAHRAALKNNICTVAVLGNGLSQIYPPANRDTAKQMLETGALLTEMPHNAPIEGYRFLQRNRIIAGLCDACIVMESAIKGGSMSTARLAREYNREVFAVPGRNIDIYSSGCNYLIQKNTASIFTSAEQLVAEMGWGAKTNENETPQGLLFEESSFDSLPGDLRSIARIFSPGEEYTPEQLLHLYNDMEDTTSAIQIGEITSRLVQLELLSVVTRLTGNRYRLS